MKKWVMHRLEEIFLIILILLNILDFTETLPGDLDFIKKLLSWTCLGYLLYKASLTKLFFGSQNKVLDLTLVLNYFLFILKNITYFAHVALEEANIFHSFYEFLATHRVFIDVSTVLSGIVFILVHTAILTYYLHVKKPSLMHVIHEEGIPKTTRKKIERFFVVFFVLIAFFVVIFNLMMEWLAIAVDAPLLMILLVFFGAKVFIEHFKKENTKEKVMSILSFIPVFMILIFFFEYIGRLFNSFMLLLTLIISYKVFFHRRSKDTFIDRFIFEVGTTTDEFYERFIELFHQPHRILLGLSGMLVLHLLTDIGNFMVPSILGIHDAIYFEALGESTHQPIFHLLVQDIEVSTSIISKISVVLIYCFNLTAMLLLLALPAYIWYKLYHRAGFKVSHIALAILYVSLAVFILTPTIQVKPISEETIFSMHLIGVDLETSQLSNSLPHIIPLGIAFLIGIAVYALSYSHMIKEKMIALAIILVDIFLARYIFFYVKTLVLYYTYTGDHIDGKGIIPLLFTKGGYNLVLALFFTLIFICTILFYIGSFVVYILETKKEFKYIR